MCKQKKIFHKINTNLAQTSLSLLLLLQVPIGKALESEQCVAVGGELSTVSFKTEVHETAADFWSKGVDNSKGILESILTKIKSYEQNADTDWIDILQENFLTGKGKDILEINEGEIWRDGKSGMAIKMHKGSLCAVVDRPNPLVTELSWTCQESEQLYGIGYHKVYESCKNDPFLSKFSVDWGVCLHSHYPWVDLLSSNICVMKSYNNEFLACFCSLDNGVIHRRGFCITKVECLMNGLGVAQNKIKELEVQQDCIDRIQYFLEPNTNDDTWFKNAQKKDNLRVRAPYHSDSPCRDLSFTARFDIGQIDLNNIVADIEVYTPFVQDFEDINESEEYQEDDMSCMPEIAPEMKEKMEILRLFFEERMMANLAIWIPGIFFVYSAMFDERGMAMNIFVCIVQLLISAIGIFNIVISVLPESFYSLSTDVRKDQISVFGSVIFLTQILLNYKEVAEHFLTVSIINFIPDIVFWKTITVMYNAQRMFHFKIIISIYFILLISYSILKLRKILTKINDSTSTMSTVAENNKKKSNSRKKREKTKQNENTMEDSNKTSTNSSEKKVSKAQTLAAEVFPIICQWRCSNVLNIGYISINCSDKCYNQYHTQCWGCYKDLKHIDSEENLLGTSCLTSSCDGKIYEIVWVDKFGIETPRKFISTELEKLRVGNRKRVKTKKPQKITRSVSETSQSSVDDKQSPRLLNKILNEKINCKISPLNSLEEKHKIPYRPIAIIKPTKTYASTVRDVNKATTDTQQQTYNIEDSLHDSKLVEELLGQNCPESFDPSCKLPQRSKILTLIRENSNSDYSFKGSIGEIGSNKDKESAKECSNEGTKLPSGFIIDSQTADQKKPSECLVFVPGTKDDKAKDRKLDKMVEGKITNSANMKKRDVVDIALPKDYGNHMDNAKVSPLAKILVKQMSGYSLQEVDFAINEILKNAIKFEDMTIPTFRNLLIEKLESILAWKDGVYMSDGEEEDGGNDVEECLICTEPMDKELQTLEPCGHVFHFSCIRKWVLKDSSCPKCRAMVQL